MPTLLNEKSSIENAMNHDRQRSDIQPLLYKQTIPSADLYTRPKGWLVSPDKDKFIPQAIGSGCLDMLHMSNRNWKAELGVPLDADCSANTGRNRIRLSLSKLA